MERYISPSKRANCATCGKLVYKSRTSAAIQRCRACRRATPAAWKARGKSLTRWTCGWCGQVCERPPTKGQTPKWCGPVCAAQGTRPLRTKVCGWCRAEYRTRERRSTACSAVHGFWLGRYGVPSNSLEMVLLPRPRPARVSRVQPSSLATPWWRVIVQGPCSWSVPSGGSGRWRCRVP